ncbi:hypothetical protein F5880DRAFT_1474355, partial [Lentinula raphanica]
APPSVFGYLIFAALVLLCSACNTGDGMTLLLQYWLASSGDFFLPPPFCLFCLRLGKAVS